MIAALFVETDGAYYGLPDVDPWDQVRDARRYTGPHSVVAHPPCSSWCHLAPVNKARYGHEIGDDDGCFESALSSVRQYGGVLEHPAQSIAFSRFDLPTPGRGGWSRRFTDPGWACEVAQSAYGHKARKLTWLYYVGSQPPNALCWSRPRGTHQVGHDSTMKRQLPRLSPTEAKATPIAFRDALLGLARQAVVRIAA